MKKVAIGFLIISIFNLACKQNESKVAENGTNTTDSTEFFHVSQYIKSQIEEVDKTPYYIYRIGIVDEKKDSSSINTAIFKQLSEQFLKPDINDPSIKKSYTENIFHDQTTKSFTISYSTANPELGIKNIEVLLQEDGQTVKRVFIRKFINYTDSTAIEQLSWKAGERFNINRLVQMPDKSEIERQTIVVWNEKS